MGMTTNHWTPHTGHGAPVPADAIVTAEVEYPDGFREIATGRVAPAAWDWTRFGEVRGLGTIQTGRVLRYRRDGAIQRLVDLAEGLPEPVREDA